jgi:hypothetical protein
MQDFSHIVDDPSIISGPDKGKLLSRIAGNTNIGMHKDALRQWLHF